MGTSCAGKTQPLQLGGLKLDELKSKGSVEKHRLEKLFKYNLLLLLVRNERSYGYCWGQPWGLRMISRVNCSNEFTT